MEEHEGIICHYMLINCIIALLFLPLHVLTSFLEFQELHGQTRNVSAEPANTWGGGGFMVHVSYIPVRKIKLWRAQRAEWRVN